MEIGRDVRFALRALKRSPGLTAVLVLILAAGIGANTAMFTVVSSVLLKPLPSPEGHRVMHLGTTDLSHGVALAGVSYPDFVDWQSQSRSFSGLGLFEAVTFNVSDGPAAAEPVASALITANGFEVLRVAAAHGRGFQSGDDLARARPVALLSYGFWMSRYGGDRAAIGRVIRIDERPATIVGVMPKGMLFPGTAQIWMPLVPTSEHQRREARQFEAFGRLRDGVSREDARSEMDLLGRRLESQYPETNRGIRPMVTPYTQRVVGDMRVVFIALQAAVGFLLLVICANAANLLLARAIARTREIAIRAALGARRAVLVRQLLIESLMYAVLGGVMGLVLAYAGVRAFDAAVSGNGKPYWLTFDLDWSVFAFLAATVLATGIAFGLAPALYLPRVALNERLKESGRGSGAGRSARRMSAAFVLAQFAVTVVMLVGFGLLGQSIVNMYAQSAAFDSQSVLTVYARLAPARYRDDIERRRFADILLARIRELPQVETAAIATHLPLGGSTPELVEAEGQPAPADGRIPPVATVVISPGYLQTFGIRLVAGRAFAELDGTPGNEHVLVNQRFAAMNWPGAEALGRRVRLAGNGGSEWFTVSGVVADVRQNRATAREPAPVVYFPSRAMPPAAFTVAVRACGQTAGLAEALRDAIRRTDPDVRAGAVMTMSEIFRIAHWPHRVFGSMFAILGLVAAVLAGLGLYSVIAFSVGMRNREIGIRISLGASRGQVSWMVIWQGLRQTGVGLALGFIAAAVFTRGLNSLLVGVSPGDPVAFLAAGAFQAAVAASACAIPAHRASTVDPIEALRNE